MRNQVNLFVALLCIVTAPLTTASTLTSQVVLRIDKCEYSNSLEIKLTNLQAAPATVSLKEIAGVVLFSDQIAGQTTYTQTMCLDNMPDGDYVVLASHQGAQTTRVFRIDGDEVLLFSQHNNPLPGKAVLLDAGDGSAKCIVRLGAITEERIRLQLANIPECGVSVEIFGPSGKVIRKDYVVAQQSFDKKYSLQHQQAGRYTLVLHVGNATLIQYILLSGTSVDLGQQASLRGAAGFGKQL